MKARSPNPFATLPSVDRLLSDPDVKSLIVGYGRTLTRSAIRLVLNELRRSLTEELDSAPDNTQLIAAIEQAMMAQLAVRQVPVFNLTGTVLHTNLGRAPLPQEAVDAMAAIAGTASNLEFDLARGSRGDRDDLVAPLICQLTGAEAATVVNNNAAAVILALSSLANRRQVLVSRGELIEIGGAFRLPDIMSRSGAKLREVGTTNRTHLRDYEDAIDDKTGMILKAHTSNYVVQGFTKGVAEAELAKLAGDHRLPFVVDLGSGSLIDLTAHGLPAEQTVSDTLAAGADLVTFSGDKLLGGPQAGLIVGRADLIAKLKRNPLKRALRIDKVTMAALEAVLRLYLQPEFLADRLPALKLLRRPVEDIQAQAMRIKPLLQANLDAADVAISPCRSQIGSGALPVEALDSVSLVLSPAGNKRQRNSQVKKLAAHLRALPRPVIGRVHEGALHLDLRCLEDEATFVGQLSYLKA